MSEATATQLNRFPEATEFTLCPVQFLGVRKNEEYNPFAPDGHAPERAKTAILSLIYTYRKNFGPKFKLTNAQIARKTGLVASTVSYTLKRLILVDKVVQETTPGCYKILPLITNKKYIVLDSFLNNQKFNVNGKLKKLPKSPVVVLDRIKAFYLEQDKDGNYINYDFDKRKPINRFKSSTKGLAKLLNLPESTVADAILILLRNKLLYRNKRLRYIDENSNAYYKIVEDIPGNTLSVFVVPYEVLAVERRSTYTPPTESEFIPENFDELEKAGSVFEIPESEIEKVYAELHTQAVERAAEAREKAFKDEALTAAKAELDEATTELFAAQGKDEIQKADKHINVAQRVYVARLAELGLSEDDLSPQFLCKRCRDTGINENGRRCRCRSRIKTLIISRILKRG